MVCGLKVAVNQVAWQAEQGGVLWQAPHPNRWMVWHCPKGADHWGVGVKQVGSIYLDVLQICSQCWVEQGSIVCRASPTCWG